MLFVIYQLPRFFISGVCVLAAVVLKKPFFEVGRTSNVRGTLGYALKHIDEVRH